MREKILNELEIISEERGRYTMVNDWCSAAIVTRRIRSLYRKLDTAISLAEYIRPLNDAQLRTIYEIERDRAARYKGTVREAGAEREHQTVRREMLRRKLLGGDNDSQTW